jgi:hypothetical protein
MLLVGGGALFACLYLPPWLELRVLRQVHAAAQQRIAGLEADLARVEKQIEHLRDDPAYLERLARQEFGTETPGVEMIWVETSQPTASQAASAPTAAPERDEDFAATLERATRNSPFVSVFVLSETRPLVMIMSGALMAAALMLLRHDRKPGSPGT